MPCPRTQGHLAQPGIKFSNLRITSPIPSPLSHLTPLDIRSRKPLVGFTLGRDDQQCKVRNCLDSAFKHILALTRVMCYREMMFVIINKWDVFPLWKSQEPVAASRSWLVTGPPASFPCQMKESWSSAPVIQTSVLFVLYGSSLKTYSETQQMAGPPGN